MTTTVNGTVWNQAEVNFMADAFGAVSEDDSIQVETLMKSIKASGKFTKDTNKDCAHLLNLCGLENESKYPQHVPCYDSIYKGLLNHPDFNEPGIFLYKKEKNISKPLRNKQGDLRLRSGEVVECDPDYPLCLVYFVPSGVDVSGEENKYAYKVHFGGHNNLLETHNVVFRHGNHFKEARSDKRVFGRCCFRYRVRAAVAPEPTAEAKESAKDEPTSIPGITTSFGEADYVVTREAGVKHLLRSSFLGELDSVLSRFSVADHLKDDQLTQALCSTTSNSGSDIDYISQSWNLDMWQPPKKRKATLATQVSNGAWGFEESNLHAIKFHKVTNNERVMVTVTQDGKDHTTAANAASDAELWEYFTELLEKPKAQRNATESTASATATPSPVKRLPVVPSMFHQPLGFA